MLLHEMEVSFACVHGRSLDDSCLRCSAAIREAKQHVEDAFWDSRAAEAWEARFWRDMSPEEHQALIQKYGGSDDQAEYVS